MRLSVKEKDLICESLTKNLSDIEFKVFLFGSRVSDYKKGGDVDLLIQVSPSDFSSMLDKKYLLKYDLEEAFGDQRNDLTISTENKMTEDPFLVSIQPDLIDLKLL